MSGFRVQQDGGLASFILDNPPVNTLTPDTFNAMAEEFRGRAKDYKTKLILIESSKDKVFSYGIDPATVLSRDLEGRRAVFGALGNLTTAALESGIPIITKLQGAALAGGAVLALLGDIVLAHAENMKLSFSETKVGIPTPPVVWELIARHLPSKMHVEMAAMGRNLDGASAASTGLFHGFFQTEKEFAELLDQYASRFLRLPAGPVRSSLISGRAAALNASRQLEEQCNQLDEFLGDDYIGEGLKAASEGRPPNFPS